MFVVTGNPLFLWEATSIAYENERPMPQSAFIYFACRAERVISATVARKGLDRALSLTNHQSKYNQFVELKEPNSPSMALWFRDHLLKLAANFDPDGKKTKAAIIAHLAEKLPRSESTIRKWYLNARNGGEQMLDIDAYPAEGSLFDIPPPTEEF